MENTKKVNFRERQHWQSLFCLKVLFPPMSNEIKNANETDEKWRESDFFPRLLPTIFAYLIFSTHQRVIFHTSLEAFSMKKVLSS